MGKWWQSEKTDVKDDKKDKKDTDEFELKPKEVKEQLDKVGTLEKGFNDFKSKAEGQLDDVSNYIKEQRAKEAKAAKDAADKNKKETQTATDEELNDVFVTDPANATRKIVNDTLNEHLKPLVESTVNNSARMVIKDIFENRADEFEYYTDPTIKKEVESLVASMALANRTNPDAIINAYYVAKGRHEKDIKEGKIKSSLSAASSAGSGTGKTNTSSEETVTLTDAQKKAAKVFGMSEQDYAKGVKETSYV